MTTHETAIYLRQSMDRDRTNVAVDRQREDLLRLCAGKGWGQPHEYVDNNVSATKGVRPSYRRLCRDIEKGSIARVAVWDLDRLHRQPAELESFIDLADRMKIELATVSGETDLSTPQGRLMARIKGSVARHEMEQKSMRHKRANRQKAESGRSLLYNVRPFGYKENKLIEHEAEAIRQGCRDLLSGASLYSIAQSWNGAGLTGTRGKPFSGETVRQVLINPRIAGLMIYQGVILEGVTPEWRAIVDRDVWESVRALLSDPKRFHAKSAARRYLLSGIALCGVCGKPLKSSSARATDNKMAGAYYCARQGCMKVSRGLDATDQFVIDTVTSRLAQRNAALTVARPDVNLAALRNRITELQGQIDAANNEYDNGDIDARRLNARIDRVNEKLKPLQDKYYGGRMPDDVKDLAGRQDAAQKFEALPLLRRRRVIDSLLTIVVFPQRPGSRFDENAIDIVWKHEDSGPPKILTDDAEQLPHGYWDGQKMHALNPEQLEAVRAMRAGSATVRGASQREVANHFGLPAGVVRSVTRDVVAIGRPKHQRGCAKAFTPERVDEIKTMWAAGMTADEIAANHGVHPATIRRYLRQNGMAPKGTIGQPRKFTDPYVIEELRRRKADGQTWKSLGAEFGVCPQTIRNTIRRYLTEQQNAS
jgi:DNA invertase Pin-like site-specific DNA recombinase